MWRLSLVRIKNHLACRLGHADQHRIDYIRIGYEAALLLEQMMDEKAANPRAKEKSRQIP